MRRVLASLWSRLPLILVLVVVAAAVAYLWSASRTDLYRATSKIRVVDPSSEAVFQESGPRVDPKRNVDTQIQLVLSDDTRADVNQTLGAAASQIDSVSVSSVGSTDLIAITVSSPSPTVAADAANAYADVFVAERKEKVTAAFTARADGLRAKATEMDQQIRELDDRLGDRELPGAEADLLRAQRTTLVGQQADLRTRATENDIEAATRSGAVEVAETATVPTVPYSPNPERAALLAAGVALLVGVGLVLLLDRLDDKLHDPSDVDAVAGGLPVIGVIPIDAKDKRGVRRLGKAAPRHLVELDSTTAEAYRALRSNLRFSAVGSKLKTVLLTSSEGAEGKSTVAANLAMVLAESGLRVVLVSADLRKPTLAGFFDIPETEKGLTSVLLGDDSVVNALVPVTMTSGRTVYVLPTGPLPQNPAEVLGGPAMRELLDSLERAGADFVLIDSPPVLPVADALALSQFTDGVLVLSLAGRTPKGHLAETLDRLRKVDADLVGVVLNGVPTKGRYAHSYGGYSYGYRGPAASQPSVGAGPPAAPAAPARLGDDLPQKVDQAPGSPVGA